jgi:hypothetical protein
MLIFLFLKSERGEEREGALVANFQSDEGHSHTAPISYKQEREIILNTSSRQESCVEEIGGISDFLFTFILAPPPPPPPRDSLV